MNSSNKIYFSSVIFFILIILLPSPQAEQLCQPGSSVFYQCNACTCGLDGNIITCTQIFCLGPDNPEQEEPSPKQENKDPDNQGPGNKGPGKQGPRNPDQRDQDQNAEDENFNPFDRIL